MAKPLQLVVSLTFCCICVVEAAPTSALETLEFDDALDEMVYEIEEEDLDDLAKLLDQAEEDQSPDDDEKSLTAKDSVSGFKKKNTSKKGANSSKDIRDFKKFYKSLNGRDRGAFDDSNIRANAESLNGKAVGIKGKEDIKYRKGTKTRGFHRVHHKDEYKKDKVIYEDNEVKGNISKVGAKAQGYKVGAKAGASKGHFHHDRHKSLKGREAYSDKGVSDRQYKGYSDSQGFDAAFNNDS